jgi:DNA-binding MarR family transcriptional regulator
MTTAKRTHGSTSPRPESAADDMLALEDFLPYRLNRLADAVSREFQKIYKDREGLTVPEWRVFATLGQFGTMTATAIGAHSAMHKTKVSRAVAELERRKWLQRETNEVDRRVEKLELTRLGRQVYRDLVPLAKAFERRLLDPADVKLSAALMRGLDMLEARLHLKGR